MRRRTLHALAFPKPVGAVDKARTYSVDCMRDISPLRNAERHALRHIAETADIIDVGDDGFIYEQPRQLAARAGTPGS